jgi:hypothetical protein
MHDVAPAFLFAVKLQSEQDAERGWEANVPGAHIVQDVAPSDEE